MTVQTDVCTAHVLCCGRIALVCVSCAVFGCPRCKETATAAFVAASSPARVRSRRAIMCCLVCPLLVLPCGSCCLVACRTPHHGVTQWHLGSVGRLMMVSGERNADAAGHRRRRTPTAS